MREIRNRTMTKKPLTERQTAILDFLKSYISKNGFAPTTREIQTQFKMKSQTSAIMYLNILHDKNYIFRQPNASRAIRIL